MRVYRLICARRFMSSGECIDCDAVGRKFPHVAHRCTPLGGHFDRWPPLLIPSPKQIQTLVQVSEPNDSGYSHARGAPIERLTLFKQWGRTHDAIEGSETE